MTMYLPQLRRAIFVWLTFETVSHNVTQADLELTAIPLPLPSESTDDRYETLYPAQNTPLSLEDCSSTELSKQRHAIIPF